MPQAGGKKNLRGSAAVRAASVLQKSPKVADKKKRRHNSSVSIRGTMVTSHPLSTLKSASGTYQQTRRRAFGDFRVEADNSQYVLSDPVVDTVTSQVVNKIDKSGFKLTHGQSIPQLAWDQDTVSEMTDKFISVNWIPPISYTKGNNTVADDRGQFDRVNSFSINIRNLIDEEITFYANGPKATLDRPGLVKYREDSMKVKIAPNSTYNYTTGFRADFKKLPVQKDNGNNRVMYKCLDFCIVAPTQNENSGTPYSPDLVMAGVTITANYLVQDRQDIASGQNIDNSAQYFELHTYGTREQFLSTENDPISFSNTPIFVDKSLGGSNIKSFYLRANGGGESTDGLGDVTATVGDAYWALHGNQQEIEMPKGADLPYFESHGFKAGDFFTLPYSVTMTDGSGTTYKTNLFILREMKSLDDYRGSATAGFTPRLVAFAVNCITDKNKASFFTTSMDAGMSINSYDPLVSSVLLPVYRVQIYGQSGDMWILTLLKVLTVATKIVKLISDTF